MVHVFTRYLNLHYNAASFRFQIDSADFKGTRHRHFDWLFDKHPFQLDAERRILNRPPKGRGLLDGERSQYSKSNLTHWSFLQLHADLSLQSCEWSFLFF